MKSEQDLNFQVIAITFCSLGIALCYLLAVVFDHFGWTL
jgi:fructose-specific phosphotransferase system component IIB